MSHVEYSMSYPNATGCWDREIFPITFCKTYNDLTYEYCREVPESEVSFSQFSSYPIFESILCIV